MRILLCPIKPMTSTRLIFTCTFIFVCVATFYLNFKLIHSKGGHEENDREITEEDVWKSLGVETRCRRFIVANPFGVLLDDVQAYRSNLLITHTHGLDHIKLKEVMVNINQSDVVVMLHIQKTGGTYLEDSLALHLQSQPPISCKAMSHHPDRLMCSCLNEKGQDWLFLRHCVGWPCGVHGDFSDLTSCVDHWFNSQPNENRLRKYHYITVIRDPVARFFSEWLHVRRGANWKEVRLYCRGREASLQEVPYCFKMGSWINVTFQEFLNCPSNLAFNRQTHMLANMSLGDCYKLNSTLTRQERDEIILQSAKDNLARFFTFFGIVEYTAESQSLFEKTFLGLKFKKRLTTKRASHYTGLSLLSEDHWNQIVEKNLLDVRLYQYAKDLFLQRLNSVGIVVSPRENEAKLVGEDFTFTIVDA